MLEGRDAVHADEERNYGVGHDPAPMPGPAVTGSPKGGANMDADAGVEKKD